MRRRRYSLTERITATAAGAFIGGAVGLMLTVLAGAASPGVDPSILFRVGLAATAAGVLIGGAFAAETMRSGR